MISGSQQKATGRTLMTGLAPATILAVNPTSAEYTEITGFETKREMTYDIVDFGDGKKFRPLHFLTYTEDVGYNFIKILYSDAPIKSKDGAKGRYVDDKGQFTHYVADPQEIKDHPKINWFTDNLRPAVQKEELLFRLLQSLIRYSPKAEGAQFLIDMQNSGYSPEAIMAGDVSSITKLIKFANDFDNQVIVPYCVSETEDGNFQNILTIRAPFYWSTGNLSHAKTKFAELMEEVETDKVWSVDFVEYTSSPAPEGTVTEDQVEDSFFSA